MLSLRTPISTETCSKELPIPRIGSRSLELAATAIELEPGERLFREGSRATALYYVVAGTIKAEISSDCFETRVIGYFRRGDVMGFTYSETMLYTATAVSAARLYCYPADLLMRRFAREPKAAERMMRSAVSSLARMLALLAIVRSASPRQRIAAYLMTKVEAGELMDRNQATIEMDISRSDLATLLGIPVAAVDASLEELAAAGLIRMDSATAVEIHDVEQIEILSLRSSEPPEKPGDCSKPAGAET